MNLLCPNCQKMLTVPEEFAGQLMKCPLCNGTFTVPGLPGAVPPPAAEPEPDIYSVRPEPVPPPAAPPLSHFPPPPVEPQAAPPPPQKPPRVETDHQRTLSVSLSPIVLPWIAPVCLVLVFFLQFFDWDGLYPGGEPAVTGNAWRAGFGAYSVDGDLKNYVNFGEDDKYKPGASVLTIFYLLLFIPALIVTIASVVVDMVPINKLPPQVNNLLPWRWGIVAAANLILFLILALQLLLGFSLDSRYREWVDNETKLEAKSNPTTQERKTAEARRGELLGRLRHTTALRLVVLLHLIAVVSSAFLFWMDRRGTHRPLPKLELRW
jgi:hypothetical protein